MILGHHRPRTGVFLQVKQFCNATGTAEMPLVLNDGEQLPFSRGLIEHIISRMSTSSCSENESSAMVLSDDTIL
jgi:hypothetical protein